MEVISIKKSHQNQEAELKYEIDRLKGQLQRAKEDFSKVSEKNKKVRVALILSHNFFLYTFNLHVLCLLSLLSLIYSFQTRLSSQIWNISLKKPREKQTS